MNTKLFLLLGTSLSFLPQLTFAQCVATQDCATLGYTETSCNGGKGVKCPFGNKWACLPTKESVCKEEGFTLSCNETGQIGGGDSCNGLYKQCSCDSSYKYTCTGTGYSGGSGTACGGKYTKCKCSSNYSWNGSSCASSCDSSYKYTCVGTGYAGGSGSACGGKYAACSCASGYEWKNGTCQNPCTNQNNGMYNDVYCCNGKVVGVRATGMSFYVAKYDLPVLTWNSANSQCRSYAFCGNIKGTLPTKDQLVSIYNNKSRVNTLLLANGGEKMAEKAYWSSTYNYDDRGYYFIVYMSNGRVGGSPSVGMAYVRPILTSW